MKILLVSYIYGESLVGGAEAFMAGLTRTLARRGHRVEVATTTANALRAPSAFGIHWDAGFPEGVTEEGGLLIHRFRVKNRDGLQKIASKLLLKRVFKDLVGRSYLDEDPEDWIRFLIGRARRRPEIYQALYRFCRGPASPGLTRFLEAQAGSYDLLLGTMVPFNTMAYAVRAAKRAQRPVGVIPLFHHLDWYHHWRHFYDTFRTADHLFVLNDYSAKLFREMGCRTTRLGVGFDPDAFPADPKGAAAFRARFGLPETGALLLFVGRKVQSKRYDLAMETTARLRREGRDAFLVMVGPNEDQRAVEGEGVYYLNRLSRNDLLLAYQACDLLLEPTEFESFGIIFCEAWMYDKPVIGNRRCPAVTSLIRHGEDGFLCATVEEFAEAALRILDDPALAGKMGRRGHEKVLREDRGDEIADRLEAAITGGDKRP